MKLVLKIFNIIILAMSAIAGIFLFATPTISLASRVSFDVAKFSEFVPTSATYGENIDIPALIGTDTIQLGVNFRVTLPEASKFFNKDRDLINEKLIGQNMEEIVNTLHEPIDLISEYTIRAVMKNLIKSTITTYVEEAKHTYETNYGTTISATAEEIMDEVGIDDAYFTSFANNLYDASNIDGTTTDAVSQVLFNQIDEALALAEDSGMVDASSFGDETKAQVKNFLVSGYTEMDLVNEDNTIKPIGSIAYIYLTKFVKEQCASTVDPASLERQTGETMAQYSDRLLAIWVYSIIPDVTYDIISYVMLGLFIGLFIFAILWVVLFTITLVRMFSNQKPWTIFGPWFWILGPLQILLGVAITVAGKFYLPTAPIYGAIPMVSEAIFALRTYALVPSLIFIAMIPVGIVYAILRSIYKNKMKQQQMGAYGGR